MERTLRMEVQIRTNNNDVPSDDASNVTDVSVVTDEMHPNVLKAFEKYRVYLRDDHDGSDFDVDLQHTDSEDADWSDPHTASTVSPVGSDTVTIDGPIGRFRFVARTSGITTAPSNGSLVVEVEAVG